MGNTPPSPAEARPALLPPLGVNESSQSVEYDQKLKSNFQLISPMSDISNPSQFRHRFPAPANREVRREGRLSKGEPLGLTRSRSLPAPSRFYFDTENRPRSPEPARRRSSSQRGRSRTRKWKRKALRAKQQLTSCWKDNVDDGALKYSQVRSRKSSVTHVKQHYVQPKRESREPSNRLSRDNQDPVHRRRDSNDAVLQPYKLGRCSSSTGHSSERLSGESGRLPGGQTRPYLQLEQVVAESVKNNAGKQHTSDINFRPVWKEQKDMAPKEQPFNRPRHQHSHPHKAFLHSEESFLERILEKSGETNSPSTNFSDPRQEENQEGVAADQHQNHLSRLEQALNSPVAKLFQDRNSSPDSPFDEDSFAGASEKSSPYDEKRARDEAKTGLAKRPLRASLEPVNPKESLGASDPLQASIEQAMQRQIDAQVGPHRELRPGKSLSRVERLQSQFQEHVQKLSAEKLRPAQEDCEPTYQSNSMKNIARLGDPKVGNPPKKIRSNDDGIQSRSSSVPPQRSSTSTAKTSVALAQRSSAELSSSRSVSVPPQRRRSSTSTGMHLMRSSRKSEEMPGLLYLAGWNPVAAGAATSRTSSESSELPVLLKLAGWNRSGKSHSFPVAGQTKRQPQIAKNEVVGRASDPLADRMTSEPSRQRMLTVRFEEANKRSGDSVKTHPTRTENRGGSPHRKRSESKVVVTTASMLQQTFPIAAAFSTKKSTATETDYRQVALKTKVSPGKRVVHEKEMVVFSPALSVDSHLKQSRTPTGSPPVTEEALRNAAFLFSPSYDAQGGRTTSRLTEPPRHGSSSFTISTLGSRSRLSAMIHAVEIPRRVSSQSESSSSKENRRQVRFSDAHDIITIQKEPCSKNDYAIEHLRFPAIESKMSDLTDVTNPTCDLMESCGDDHIEVFEDDDGDENMSKFHQPIMNWSYCKDDAADNGVTPLRPGQISKHATNSPYIRFQEAKSKFSTSSKKRSSLEAKTKCAIAPVKRNSPIKRSRGGLVHARIEAMEQQQVNGSHQQQHQQSKIKPLPKRARRATTGYKVLAPRKGSLVSQFHKLQVDQGSVEGELVSDVNNSTTFNEHKLRQTELIQSNSRELRAAEAVSATEVDKTVNSETSGVESFASTVCESRANGSDLNDDSDFAAIMHPAKLDEESVATSGIRESLVELFEDNHHSGELPGRAIVLERNENNIPHEEDEDDFAELLNYQTIYDENESIGEETASTVRQDRNSVLRTYFSSYHMTNPDNLSCSSKNATSNASSIGTVRMARESLVSVDESTCTRSTVEKPKLNLAFREKATVRPTEQNHRINTGNTGISISTRSPMQARTWRALAAAAHEKDSKRTLMDGNFKRKSFAELNPNIM